MSLSKRDRIKDDKKEGTKAFRLIKEETLC
ncbi:hypothetical protein DEAC_c21350 [Desulfosporosinus acididurans]|uniref:Uncharacterized protein n=1 Tax=Desulfosporosinus acididurans TaxID=476652 RepID=A0A0J1IN36_9FIRM|nr:hypothetical protein DEAC_c21350 [Desulfosporosinus acididurans]